MKQENTRKRSNQFSHLLILISYSVLAAALTGETFLLGWEKWPLVPIIFCVLLSWFLHISKTLTDIQRLWVYTLTMMGAFLFYGVHPTSTYDIAIITAIVIMLYTTSGETKLILTAVITYYITMAFDIVEMFKSGAVWDGLAITRTVFHIFMVTMAGWLGRAIIRQWAALFRQSDEQISDLNEATRRMNFFMANLSHELRTPLNAILGITDGILDKEDDESLRSDMEAILAAGQRIERQTDDILDFSELATDGLAVNAGPCVLSSVLNDIASMLRPVMPGALELVIDVDPMIPAVLVTDSDKLKRILWHLISNGLKFSKEGGVYVRITSVRQSYGINLLLEVTDTGVGMTEEELESIFRQFYQADSGRSVRSGGLGIGLSIVNGFVSALGGFMTIKSRIGEGTTVNVSLPMEVEDESPCMVMEASRNVVLGGYLNFLKYPDPRVREYYNSMVRNIVLGLGTTLHRVDNPEDLRKLEDSLALTHLFVGEAEYRRDPALIEALAKKMIVAVIAHDDTVLPPDSRAILMQKPFYCFPVINILNMSPQEERRPEEKMLCPGVRALVVDDEPMNLHVAAAILQRFGMRVMTVSSGPEAVKLCAETVFDIIFMDHMMPNMDGLETMRQIHMMSGGKNSFIPIVMLTANTLSTARDMFFRAGVDGFVGKPIEKIELERVLKRVLPASAIRYESLDKAPKTEQGAAPEAETKASAAEGINSLEAYGVEVSKGLHYCQDDEAFYLELLAQYASEVPSRTEELSQFFSSGDYEGYEIVVHALKSTSKMIGADALSETARQLEEAAKKSDEEQIRALHPGLIEAYKSLAKGIGALQGVGNKAQEPAGEVLEFLPDEEE